MQRVLYRSLLRGALELHRAAVHVGVEPTAELRKFACPSPALQHAPVRNAQAAGRSSTRTQPLWAEVRRQFRLHRKYDPASEDTAELLESGFRALRQCSRRVSQLRDAAWRPKRAEVHFGVGQCVTHATYGYRAVVVGWDARCEQDAEWQHAMAVHELAHGAEQPFYHCLVDVRDREPAQTTYVAQENVTLVAGQAWEEVRGVAMDGGKRGGGAAAGGLEEEEEEEEEEGGGAAAAKAALEAADGALRRGARHANPVMHPAVTDLMTCFIASEARYVPNEEVRNLYPED